MAGATRGRSSKYTPEVHRQIVASIRAGAFAHVAAQAAGINPATYWRWMASPDKKFAQFREDIEAAQAQARLSAELHVKKADPQFWLLHGPGRERPGNPGWSKQTAITGGDGGPVQAEVKAPEFDLGQLSMEELTSYRDLLRKAQKRDE